MLVPFQPSTEGPVTILFGTFGYRKTIEGWIEHARRAGCAHYRIVCMDSRLLRHLHDAGTAEHAIDYDDILPGAPRPDIDALRPELRLRALTPLRVRLFHHLAANGCDFIHSDADAFWLRDPRPWLMRHRDCDLLVSQGTTFPRCHYHRHRFVLCAGFFLCRAGDRTRDYFARVDALLEEHPSDQLRMNAVLLRDSAPSWTVNDPVPFLRARHEWIRPPLEPYFGRFARYLLARPPLRMLSDYALRICGVDYILTSRRITRGRFSAGLTAGIIPMHLVVRGAFADCDDPLVVHSSHNKSR